MKGTLRFVCKDTQSTFEKLLDKDKSFNIHHRNLQVLVTEIYIKYILKLPQALWMIYLKETKYRITLGTIVILFQEILNLYILDQKQYHI